MKITKTQLKQIIKEAIAEDPRDFPMGYESEPRRDTGRLVDPILASMKEAYDSLQDPGEQKLLEDDLLNGLGDLVAAWRQAREARV